MRFVSALLLTWLATAAPARADEILVHAAASLTDALEEIGRAWQRSSGHTVAFNLGASSDLARQLAAGAPGDVFFSADRAQMDAVERAGRVRLTDPVELLSNALVVVVPTAASSWPRTAADLLSVERIALADPEAVPAGVYARQWLESLGLWEKLRGRVVPALNVRAALAAVESENAGAAIVYRTDAAIARRARVAFEVPREQGPRIVYVVAPLASSGKAAAREFVSYLRSADAQAVFARRGFVPLAGP
jgi:molybdate transport system substrate-binding protein